MKKQINFLLFFTFLTFSMQAQSFEGTVKLTSDSKYGLSADFIIKGDQVLMENVSKNGQVRMIMDKKTGDIITITNENGPTMAIKTNLNNNPYIKGKTPKVKDNFDDFTFEKTAETKMISGYNCTKFIGKNKDTESVMWITNDIELNLMDLAPVKQGAGRNPYNIGADANGMVMEMHVKENKGKKEWTMTAEVTEKAIDDAAFAIPEGVEVMDMTDMRQLMMEAQKNPEKMQQLKEMMQKMEGQ